MISYIRRHMGIKLFFSYLIVILVGVIVLAMTAEFVVPTAFDRHLAAMSAMMSDMMGDSTTQLELDLFDSFRAAVTESMTVAALTASVIALLASIFISRQIASPIRAMMVASQRIAEGHYEERVNVSGDLSKDQLDELEQLALSFNQMAASLERTESVRSQLIGDVAHELRTPLTAIKGSMEGLMDGVLPAHEATYLHVYNEADRLGRLVDDLQELSRVEAGAYELTFRGVAVSTLIDGVVDRLVRQFEEKQVLLVTNLAPDMPKVWVDEHRIGQVLINLLGNALQYTPSGGKVCISAAHLGDEVRISISDTGIGIHPEHLSGIFTRFYRVDKSRSRVGGGTGIGLTIARYLVESHGGRIWVESPGLNQGSTFTFSLPVAV
ncbi:MAG: ATP-binding protein [Chloroflexota bacterium]|nr:ATP-binding protein [Chloroflexota bacterium]